MSVEDPEVGFSKNYPSDKTEYGRGVQGVDGAGHMGAEAELQVLTPEDFVALIDIFRDLRRWRDQASLEAQPPVEGDVSFGLVGDGDRKEMLSNQNQVESN